MENQTFFPSTNRRVLIGSPTKQSTTKRICVPIRMPLTGESLTSMPDWVSDNYDSVSKFQERATPEIEQIADITVSFHNDKPKGKLFADPSARVPAAEIRSFLVVRSGDSEEPEVELTFKLYAPFAREFWIWLGEMAGAEVFMNFPKSLGEGVAVQPPNGKLLDEEPSAAETAALAGEKKPEDTPGTKEFENATRAAITGKKSGPKELAQFHATQGGKSKNVNKNVN